MGYILQFPSDDERYNARQYGRKYDANSNPGRAVVVVELSKHRA